MTLIGSKCHETPETVTNFCSVDLSHTKVVRVYCSSRNFLGLSLRNEIISGRRVNKLCNQLVFHCAMSTSTTIALLVLQLTINNFNDYVII